MDPNDLLKDPEQLKALISILQSLVDQAPKETEQKQDVAPSKKSPTIKTRGRQKVGANNSIKTKQTKKITTDSINKFEKMSEFRMHKDDCAVDKKLSKHPPVARMRDFEFVDVVCRVCGKKESVPPALLFDVPSRYKCNNCSTHSG